MTMSPIKTDYLVIGADAHTVMVDRHHRSGGHGTESSPSVRVNQPAAHYGAVCACSRRARSWMLTT